MTKEEIAAKIEQIEENIDFYSENPPHLHEFNLNYKSDRKAIGYEYFIERGDYNYFVARFLFLNGITKYPLYCAQQCIEDYLKSYLKYKNAFPEKDLHDLQELLILCKAADDKELFLNSDRINTIINLFRSFNELPRYPVQRNRPENGQFAVIYPTGLEPLDYFVYKMREIIPYPDKMYSVFRDGCFPHYVIDIKLKNRVDGIFQWDNINFL